MTSLLAPPPIVPRGPADYRRRIRRYGALAALLVPIVSVGIALLVWEFWPSTGGTRDLVPSVIGWILAALALPTAVLVGLPFSGGPIRLTVAIATSVVAWFVVGFAASRRATRVPVADWRDWRREYLWLAIPLWLGVLVGLGGFALLVTRG
jgi:hypothetical protein